MIAFVKPVRFRVLGRRVENATALEKRRQLGENPPTLRPRSPKSLQGLASGGRGVLIGPLRSRSKCVEDEDEEDYEAEEDEAT